MWKQILYIHILYITSYVMYLPKYFPNSFIPIFYRSHPVSFPLFNEIFTRYFKHSIPSNILIYTEWTNTRNLMSAPNQFNMVYIWIHTKMCAVEMCNSNVKQIHTIIRLKFSYNF